jgi:hypothetical protein
VKERKSTFSHVCGISNTSTVFFTRLQHVCFTRPHVVSGGNTRRLSVLPGLDMRTKQPKEDFFSDLTLMDEPFMVLMDNQLAAASVAAGSEADNFMPLEQLIPFDRTKPDRRAKDTKRVTMLVRNVMAWTVELPWSEDAWSLRIVNNNDFALVQLCRDYTPPAFTRKLMLRVLHWMSVTNTVQCPTAPEHLRLSFKDFTDHGPPFGEFLARLQTLFSSNETPSARKRFIVLYIRAFLVKPKRLHHLRDELISAFGLAPEGDTEVDQENFTPKTEPGTTSAVSLIPSHPRHHTHTYAHTILLFSLYSPWPRSRKRRLMRYL